MTDYTKKKGWFDRLGDLIKRWTINVVQVIVAIALIGVVMQFGLFYLSPDKYYDIYDPSSTSRWLARCDTLEEELAADILCRRDEACTMTREEHASYLERVDKYGLHCERE